MPPGREGRAVAGTDAAAVRAPATEAAAPASVLDVMRRADRHRGLGRPYRFRARIYAAGSDAGRTAADAASGDAGGGAAGAAPTAAEHEPREAPAADATVVDVRSNGFGQQLVIMLEPNRGDAMLATADVVWLRPRRLHRLTRIPPDLRMFSGASVSDVTSVDLLGGYHATLRSAAGAPSGASAGSTGERSEQPGGALLIDLVAAKEGVRYPRAIYAIDARTCRPRRIDFLAASGKPLKTIVYAEFREVLGRVLATRLIIEDHVFRDSSVVTMSEFEPLPAADAAMFDPDYLLALPDVPS